MSANSGHLADAAIMKDVRGYLTRRQVNELFQACNSNRDLMLIMSLYYTGRRVSEVVGLIRQICISGPEGTAYLRDGRVEGGLRPRDILEDENSIVFNILKKRRSKRKVIPVPGFYKKALLAYIEMEDIEADSRVFPITRQYAFMIMRATAKRAGIDHVGDKQLHPHHLRHSLAVHLAKARTPLNTIRLILDHSNITQTAIYLQFATSDVREDIEKVFSEPV